MAFDKKEKWNWDNEFCMPEILKKWTKYNYVTQLTLQTECWRSVLNPLLLSNYIERLIYIRDVIFQKIGEDWIFLALLGVVMAILSFTMDFIIEKCQAGQYRKQSKLRFSSYNLYFKIAKQRNLWFLKKKNEFWMINIIVAININ